MLNSRDEKTNNVCGDAGRQMFYDYVGRYFAKEISLKQAPSGTLCPVCGASDVPLFLTPQKKPVCVGQTTITSKRCGRESADEPCIPMPGEHGMAYFNETTVAIAGPHVARISTKVLPKEPLPPHVEVIFHISGNRRKWLLEMLKDPPEPPFVFIAFGKNAEFKCDITTDKSRIFINGPSGAGGYCLDRFYIADLMDRLDGLSWKDIKSMVALRERLATGQHSTDDIAALEELRAQSDVLTVFPKLPSPGSRVYSLIDNLFND